MNIVQLVPKPGQTSSVGNGPVYFMSANAPAVAQGDAWELFLTGQSPNRIEIGHMMPWDNNLLTYDGATDANGNLTIAGTCSEPGNHSLTDGVGPVIAVGVLPSGQIQIFGFYPCQFAPVGPPPPPPTLGLDNLVSLVEGSRLTGVPVADWRTQSVTVQFIAKPPYLPAPEVVTIWAAECLNSVGAQSIANALGGTVVQVSPPSSYIAFATSPVLVNGVQFAYNGQQMVAVAGEIAQAFDQLGNGADVLKAAILATFKPVA